MHFKVENTETIKRGKWKNELKRTTQNIPARTGNTQTNVRKYSKDGGGPIDYKIIYCDYSLQTSVFFLQIWETV